ncbi:putative pentatricopeptide repeat-containing protein-like [Capsicum annuum]|uniref:uncharacterized protein LOC107839820 n=1 Tax=Capsicum annuum TaxID=4072 RepID=UPI0007BEE893|nr:uncharacterized protein LOC107839820 [Capsicum annuum]KAF3668486.1 putative pentatricopeptide repeat-containing protein-like [Capsicum annuum]KAF3669513.1 putative pentatricopeptide repeat-containing protein-like [Capsicum annuum]
MLTISFGKQKDGNLGKQITIKQTEISTKQVMESMLLSNSFSLCTFLRFNHSQHQHQHQQQQLFVGCPQLKLKKKKRRGITVVTGAGGISSSSYIFAVVFPLSLLAITIFTSARIADTLDQKFLEELAVNETIREGEEDDGSAVTPLEEKPAAPRTRNRPKREVEPSSK